MQPGGPPLHARVLADRAGSWPRLCLPADFADQIHVPVLSLGWPMQLIECCAQQGSRTPGLQGPLLGIPKLPSSPMSLAENPL